MANFAISGLPAATILGDADAFETTQSGASKKSTLAQIKAAVARGNVFPVDASYAFATFSATQTDATAAIQSAVAAAKAAQGSALVVLPGGFLRTTATVTVDGDGVLVASAHEVPGAWIFDQPNSAGCTVRFHAAASLAGPVFDFTNGALTRRVYGVGLRGVTVDHGTAGNHATIGVRLRSVAAGTWSFAVNRVDAGCTGVNVGCDPALGAGAGDTQQNSFDQVTVTAVDAAHAGICIQLNGNAGSNTSLNRWGQVGLFYSNGHGIDAVNCDGEVFQQVRGNRATGSTGRCVIFRADHSGAAGGQKARSNVIVFTDPGNGGIEFEGDNGGTWTASLNNTIALYSLENTTQRAVYGANTRAVVNYYDGSQDMIGPDSGVMAVYTAAGTYTWTKPVWALSVDVLTIAGSAGGGSGRRGAAATLRTGGGGGGGGAASWGTMRAADLPATVQVAVGAGGAGGAAVTVDSTDGNAGGGGGVSRFGPIFTAYVAAGGGGGGGGGTATGAGAGGSQEYGTINGAGGGASSATGGVGGAGGSPNAFGVGGGAGGGITTGDVASGGGAGGVTLARRNIGSNAGGGVGVAGVSATAEPAGVASIGGGGGGASTTAVGGAGGAGAKGGGAGGGGGASANGFASGAGGAGGDGVVIVISRK